MSCPITTRLHVQHFVLDLGVLLLLHLASSPFFHQVRVMAEAYVLLSQEPLEPSRGLILGHELTVDLNGAAARVDADGVVRASKGPLRQADVLLTQIEDGTKRTRIARPVAGAGVQWFRAPPRTDAPGSPDSSFATALVDGVGTYWLTPDDVGCFVWAVDGSGVAYHLQSTVNRPTWHESIVAPAVAGGELYWDLRCDNIDQPIRLHANTTRAKVRVTGRKSRSSKLQFNAPNVAVYAHRIDGTVRRGVSVVRGLGRPRVREFMC